MLPIQNQQPEKKTMHRWVYHESAYIGHSEARNLRIFFLFFQQIISVTQYLGALNTFWFFVGVVATVKHLLRRRVYVSSNQYIGLIKVLASLHFTINFYAHARAAAHENTTVENPEWTLKIFVDIQESWVFTRYIVRPENGLRSGKVLLNAL